MYLPDGDQVTLDLSASSDEFRVEWMDPVQDWRLLLIG